MICKYPPIQGGVSAECYWTAQLLAEMGHQVCVLTNAQEVEDGYRISLTENDERLLSGFRKPNSVRVISTTTDRRHVFVPQVNPSVSKLLSLGLEAVETEKPDFIWAHYLEPYGVVAYLLSKLTGVSYIFRHAGSDIGRLMLTSQLERIHHAVLENAKVILTRPSHHDRFQKLGIPSEKFARSISVKLRPDLFFSTPLSPRSPIVLGVYGKTGESKGTGALLNALAVLKQNDFPFKLKAHWGGRDLSRYTRQIQELGLESDVEFSGFIPHWSIPDFIRSCDAVFFLENRFSISFHHPSVPLEIISCGRPVITTAEVAEKPLYRELLRDGENAFVIQGDVTGEAVASEVGRVRDTQGGQGIQIPTSSQISKIHFRIQMHNLLEQIRHRL